jgi:hypothetical protein
MSHPAAAGLNENEVVDAVAAYLAEQGWEVEQALHGHQRGVDVIASDGGRLLHVEAKGGTSTVRTSRKYGKAMSPGEVKINVDEAFATAAIVAGKGEALAAVAFPDDPRHRKRADALRPAMDSLGIGAFWVAPDRTVTWESRWALEDDR